MRRLPERPTNVGALILACLMLLALAPGAHAALSAAESVAMLNAQRAAHGIPAGIGENPDWSRKCALHNAYQRANGVLEHEEDPRRPGYTEDGNWAGTNSVLSHGGWSREGGNPFENAPIHLMQLLAPALEEMGVDGGCATTWPGYTRRATAPALYSYPGDGGKDVPYEQVARELPFVPGDFVGLPQGTRTGPHLYVLSHSDAAADPTLQSAALTGPEGAVELRYVTSETPKVGGYLPPGAILIPVKSLRPATSYRARVEFSVPGGRCLQPGAPPEIQAVADPSVPRCPPALGAYPDTSFPCPPLFGMPGATCRKMYAEYATLPSATLVREWSFSTRSRPSAGRSAAMCRRARRAVSKASAAVARARTVSLRARTPSARRRAAGRSRAARRDLTKAKRSARRVCGSRGRR
jgi:hypothetical protein